jgi:NAD-dependent DNA ligase
MGARERARAARSRRCWPAALVEAERPSSSPRSAVTTIEDIVVQVGHTGRAAEPSTGGRLAGRTFVFSGALATLSRHDARRAWRRSACASSPRTSSWR